jgi:hypothetical protein
LRDYREQCTVYVFAAARWPDDGRLRKLIVFTGIFRMPAVFFAFVIDELLYMRIVW